jgi:ribosome recycling factor
MGKPGPQTQSKRRREQVKREKRLAKAEKKALRQTQKDLEEAGDAPPAEEDPTE